MDEMKQEDEAGEGNGIPMELAQKEERKSDLPRPTPTPAASSIKNALQSLTDRALDFLAHASNQTLGVCLVGLAASTYLFIGRLGLLVIGTIGGVVLHATWEGIGQDGTDENLRNADRRRGREAGMEVTVRLLNLRGITPKAGQDSGDDKVYANQTLDFSSFGPGTAIALDLFTNAVIRDYVRNWYDPVIPGEQSFPNACKQTLMAFVLSMSSHLRRKRAADVFLDFAMNTSSIIIVFLNELAAALNASPDIGTEEAVSTYLRLHPDSSLAYMLDKTAQTQKLTEAAEDILEAYLDTKAYNCQPVHIFLKQVLSELVLGYTLTLCSKPEWINDWIVYGLEESETTKEVMDTLDAGVQGGAKIATHGPAEGHPARSVSAQNNLGRLESAQGDSGLKNHQRRMNKGEEAMDQAMREARLLTQLIVEEDERRAREELEKQNMGASDDMTSRTAWGSMGLPTSSQRNQQQNGEVSITSTQDSLPAPMSTDAAEGTNQQALASGATAQPQRSTNLADALEPLRYELAQLTLQNARVSISDDSFLGERSSIKAKPTTDYLVQIEPASSAFPGWMIARKYADFETLHEVLRRISVITGIPDFTTAHADLPKWRTNTVSGLRSELERYLTDALHYPPLAESEGMKRFLEREQGLQSKSPGERGRGFGWPTPDAFGRIGGDMMNVLTKAPKQVAGGGKAVFGGVAGLVGTKKSASHSQSSLSRASTHSSTEAMPSMPPVPPRDNSYLGPSTLKTSLDSIVKEPMRQSVSSVLSPEDPKDSDIIFYSEAKDTSTLESPVSNEEGPRETRPAETTNEHALGPQLTISGLDSGLEAAISLPPPPSEMPDDFDNSAQFSRQSTDALRSSTQDSRSSFPSAEDLPPQTPPRPSKSAAAAPNPDTKLKEPLTERETAVAVELLFALITELYTLSSAWQIRRALLAAAKTYLLRPGNPQLLSIRDLVQDSLLDANLSDSGLAAQIYRLRENTLPTAEELEKWKALYPEKNDQQKQELRSKARQLLVTKGMPQALTAIMGAAASGEALGKAFDCLQIEEVARGLIFGVMLQALRIVTQ